MNPIFSVVMPAYNAERFVGEAIESVLAQTLTDWELLVVNDCSTDGTLEVCNSFRDRRIRVFSTPRNLNAAGARNMALEHARGEFFALLDSDDLMAPNRLERQRDFFHKNPLVGVCGSYVETFETKEKVTGRGKIEYPCADGSIKATMFFYDPFVTSSVSMRASLICETQKPVFLQDYAPSEDYELWARWIDQSQFANMPEFLTFYRVHGSQLSQTQTTFMQSQICRVWEKLFEKVGIKESDIKITLHEALVYDKAHPFERLVQFRFWLESLWKSSVGSGFLTREDWSKTIGFWWFVTCQRTKPMSMKSWRIYRSSSLAKLFLSRRQKLQFFRDCIFPWSRNLQNH
jgi:glycosyltransferase involved in cell wall biosynthesis